jgi:hypothetical protein
MVSVMYMVCEDSIGDFVHAQKFPADWLIAVAAASNLPASYDGVVVFREPAA